MRLILGVARGSRAPGRTLFLFLNLVHKVLGAVNFPSLGNGDVAHTCVTCHSAIHPTATVQASPTTRDALGDIFTLDRRHDNPDRDGE